MRSWSPALLATLLLAACDLPTEPPRWEQVWVVPGERVAISVAELLPAGVVVAADGSAFVATTSPVHLSVTLGEACEPCAAADGTTVPKPEFGMTLAATSSLPEDLVAGVVADGELEVVLEHSFSFDPIRPAADGARGHMVLSVLSDGAVVAQDSISGEERAFPANTPLHASLPLAATTVSNSLELEVRLYSPAGDPTLIRSSDALSVDMPATEVRVGEVTVRATGTELAPTRVSMDFDLDTTMLTRIRRGALRLALENPWAVTGTLEIRFEFDGRVIQRSLAVQPGQTTQRMELTGQELRDLLGAATVDIVTTGQVTAADGTVTVTPAQELVVEADFELVLLMGGSEDDA